jgi:hypothetical protein
VEITHPYDGPTDQVRWHALLSTVGAVCRIIHSMVLKLPHDHVQVPDRDAQIEPQPGAVQLNDFADVLAARGPDCQQTAVVRQSVGIISATASNHYRYGLSGSCYHAQNRY